jgi:hypothetical protein
MVSRNRTVRSTKRSLSDRTYEEVKKLYDAQLAYDPKKHGELVYDVSEMRVLLNIGHGFGQEQVKHQPSNNPSYPSAFGSGGFFMSNKRLMPVFEAAWRAVSESAKRSAACYSQNNEVSRSKRGPMPVLEAA